MVVAVFKQGGRSKPLPYGRIAKVCPSGVSQNYSTGTIDLRGGEWGWLWLFLRWREEQAPPLRPNSQGVPIGGVAELQHRDNRFARRRVGMVVVVFALAGGASPSPTAEKAMRARDFNLSR